MSQTQTSSVPFSIIDELLGSARSDTAAGATSLIRRLLEAAANEAVEAQCDVLTGYSLVKTASEQSRAIDESILQIDENGTDDAAWAIFDKYVKEIQKLESFLLELGALPGKTGAALELDNVSVCQGSIKIWEANRTRLHTQLQKLRGADAASQAWEQKRDDAAMFQMMVSKLEPVVPTTPPDSPMLQALELLKSLLARVDDANPPHSDSVLHGIKAAWLMRGAIAEKDDATTTADRKYHLGHDDVWSLGQSFAEKIADEETAALVTAYEEFLGKLSVRNSTPPTQSYIKLMLASNNVTRPFLLRNKILVEYCRELVKLFNKHTATRAANLGNVTLAISKSLDATKAACTVALDDALDSSADLSTATSAFEEAVRKLTFSLEQYAALAKVAELDVKMKEAITEDDDRLLRLQARFKTKPRSIPEDVSDEIPVTIKGGSDSSPVTVRGSTKIRALLWSEQNKVADKTFVGARVDGTVELVDLDKEISTLAPKGGTLVLELTEAATSPDDDQDGDWVQGAA